MGVDLCVGVGVGVGVDLCVPVGVGVGVNLCVGVGMGVTSLRKPVPADAGTEGLHARFTS